MRTRLLATIVSLALLTAVACGDDDDDSASTTVTTTTITTVSTTTSTATSTTEADVAAPVVHIAVTGLVVTQADASELDLPFGTDRDTVVAAVSAALGEPTDEGDQPECPAGETAYARFGDGPDSISLDFQAGAFVGWSLGADADLVTDAGIGMGSSRTDLEAVYGPVEIEETSLGFEFFIADSLGGVIDADAPDGVITALWAGTTCIFR